MASEPQQQRRGTPTASQTQTITSLPSQPGAPTVLRLRGAHNPTRRRIQWAEDVVDNEGLGRKKSKGMSFGSQLLNMI
jgi:protein phosphatase 1 regulatory subunit 11